MVQAKFGTPIKDTTLSSTGDHEKDTSDCDHCSRARNHGLGIITLSNDGEVGNLIYDAAKFRIADEILGLKEVDWDSRSAPDIYFWIISH